MNEDQLLALHAMLNEPTSCLTLYNALQSPNYGSALRADYPQLGALPDFEALNFLRTGIADLVDNIAFTGNSERCASLILARFAFLNLAEAKHCFDLGLAGHFGALYGAATTQTVLLWFAAYQQETSEVRYWEENN